MFSRGQRPDTIRDLFPDPGIYAKKKKMYMCESGLVRRSGLILPPGNRAASAADEMLF